MIIKFFNPIFVFILVAILLPFSMAECSDSQFMSGVDLDSGKIHYPIADGAYYSESSCFNSSLTSNIVVTNLSFPYENQIVYYPDSSRIGLIDFFDNTSLFYTYLSDNISLSKVYLMGSNGNYLYKTNFSYSSGKLSRVESYFSGEELISGSDFVIEPDKFIVSSRGANETFVVSDDKIQNRTQVVTYENETYTLVDSFNYYDDKTIVVEKYNNSIVGGIVYDKNKNNISLDCYDFDEGDNAIFTSALVSYDGNFSYDYCKDNSTLVENYCGISLLRWDFWNFADEVTKQKEVICENGCFDGACIEVIDSCLNINCSVGQTCSDGICVEKINVTELDLPAEPENPERL